MERYISCSLHLKENNFYIKYRHRIFMYYSLQLQWRVVILGTRENL